VEVAALEEAAALEAVVAALVEGDEVRAAGRGGGLGPEGNLQGVSCEG